MSFIVGVRPVGCKPEIASGSTDGITGERLGFCRESASDCHSADTKLCADLYRAESPVCQLAHLAHARYDLGTATYAAVSYTHLRAHETDSYLVCRLLL